MFIKQGLVRVQSGCLVLREDLEVSGCSWQLLADTVLRMSGGVFESDTVQKIQVLSDGGTCLKPYPQWPSSSSLDAWTAITPFLLFKRVKANVQWLEGHEFDQASGVADGQGSLACCSSWDGKESDTTEQLNWIELSHICLIGHRWAVLVIIKLELHHV